ncbi:MAG: hypothetical protein M1305_03325, partial [Candidatus Marsarchaeota archaeon]|nr:hypothetical protein [Candidatus Marsarchaeota archaeon]
RTRQLHRYRLKANGVARSTEKGQEGERRRRPPFACAGSAEWGVDDVWRVSMGCKVAYPGGQKNKVWHHTYKKLVPPPTVR